MTLKTLLAALMGASALVAAPTLAEPVLITNVTVIDPTAATDDAARKSARDVLVRDGRIVSVTAAGSRSASDIRRLDGTGRFVIPGLIDSHIHLNGPDERLDSHLKLFVANGVLGVRDMGTSLPRSTYERLRDDIAADRRIGPALLGSPGRIINGAAGKAVYDDPVQRIIGPDQSMDALVAEQKAAGFDFIKPYDQLSRAEYLDLAAAARRGGMQMSGHVPLSVSLFEAIDAGQASLEHAINLPRECSRAWPFWREWYDRVLTGQETASASLSRTLVAQNALMPIVEGFDPALCASLLKRMKAAGMVYVPTHGTRRMEAFAGTPEYYRDPRLAFIDSEMRQDWNRDRSNYAALPPMTQAAYLAVHYRALDVTRLANEAGVVILAGTDAGDSFIFPGSGLHDELQRLVEAKMTPLEALRAATASPAHFLRVDQDFGAISPGRPARLVLLDADPLLDIEAVRRIHAVVDGERVLDRAALDGVLGEVRRQAAQ